jgi:hypothetical protein
MNAARIKIVLGMICLLSWAACAASAPQATAPADTQANQFQPVPDKASVYIVRGYGLAPELHIFVHIDGTRVGELEPNTYFLFTLNPGNHVFSVVGISNQEDLPADLEAGKIYFYQTSIVWAGPGIRHRHIEAMSDANGRTYVSGETRAEAVSPSGDQ